MVVDKKRSLPLNPFSPWRSPAGSLQRTLVGRDYVLKDILEKTWRFCSGAPAKHCLLIGRRGLGKTHLLSLLYHHFENNCITAGFEDISRCVLPVSLLEEERYSLHSLIIFLMRIFEKLHEKEPREESWLIPAELEEDDDIIEYCFEILKEIARPGNRKILILCDNLEEVFKQWREKDFKVLRSFLSDQQAVMIVGTAVRVFREIVSPKEPFYEFFEIVPLSDLSPEQMVELLNKRFIEDGLEEEFGQKEKYLKGKIEAISKLTGGNPRLVVFLYDIVTKKNVFEIEEATNELMEGLSEYFRSRFSGLAPQERTILDAFAGMAGPATPKEIAGKTRIKEQSTYVHIKKLKDAGFIEPVEYGKHKVSRYDVTERLFRIWRQTATISGKKRFRIFIDFLKIYFTPEELKREFHHSLESLLSALRSSDREDAGQYNRYISYLCDSGTVGFPTDRYEHISALVEQGDFKKAEQEILALKEEESKTGAERAIHRLMEGIWHKGKGRHEKALQSFRKASELEPDNSLYYAGQAASLRDLNRLEGALLMIEKAITLDEKNAMYIAEEGEILKNMGKHEKALRSFKKASKLEPENPDYYFRLAFSLIDLNRLKDALLMIDKTIELGGEKATFRGTKGAILVLMGKYEKAMQNFRKASKLDPQSAEYYFMQASLLDGLDRFVEALPLIEKVIELDEKNLSYLRYKASILAGLGKHEEAVKCYRESMDMHPDDMDHKLKFTELLIDSLKNLEEAGKYLEEIEQTSYESIKDNSNYFEYKSKYLLSTCRFTEAAPYVEKWLEKEPDHWQAKTAYLVNKSCLGEFGDHMEGLVGKIATENMVGIKADSAVFFMYQTIDFWQRQGETRRAQDLFLTLLKLTQWHHSDSVRKKIALYIKKLVEFGDKETFVNTVQQARENIVDKDLLELLKPFIYAGRYLKEGNKVIFEEVFPEVRDVIFDILEKFE